MITATVATSSSTIVEGDFVLYHGSVENLHGLLFIVTRIQEDGTLNLHRGTFYFGQYILEGVQLCSVTKN